MVLKMRYVEFLFLVPPAVPVPRDSYTLRKGLLLIASIVMTSGDLYLLTDCISVEFPG
jgi:hypothetical protein